MQVVEKSAEGLLRDFTVTVDASDIEARIEARLTEVGRDIRLPGFRPGKAPLKVLKQRFGDSVRGEVLEAAVRDSSQEVLSERGLRAASQPQIEISSYDPGKDLEYDLSVELMPDIETVDFSTIELERVKVAATDQEVDETLERLADQNKQSEAIEGDRAAKSGDVVILDFVGKVDGVAFDGGTGTGISLELGAGQFIPGFEEQLVGVKANTPCEVKVTFPEDYGSAELVGKDAVFECEIKEIREPVPTKIDDDFAKGMGLEGLDSLKDAVRDQLNGEYADYTRERLKRDLLDKLADAHSFPVPPRMLEAEFEQIWNQIEEARKNDTLDADDAEKSEDDLREQYREIAERRVRLGLVLSHVGDANSLTVAPEEVNRAIMERARQMPGQEQQVIEFYRSNPQAQASLQAPLFENKVVEFIVEMANVSDREISPEALRTELEEETAALSAEKKAAPKKKAPAKKKAAAKKPAAKGKEKG